MDIYDILNDLCDKFDKIDKKLEILEEKIEILSQSSHNMDRHISFIEGVYTKIKYPFFFFFNGISSLTTYKIANKDQLLE
jgi:hypothetical protein